MSTEARAILFLRYANYEMRITERTRGGRLRKRDTSRILHRWSMSIVQVTYLARPSLVLYFPRGATSSRRWTSTRASANACTKPTIIAVFVYCNFVMAHYVIPSITDTSEIWIIVSLVFFPYRHFFRRLEKIHSAASPSAPIIDRLSISSSNFRFVISQPRLWLIIGSLTAFFIYSV